VSDLVDYRYARRNGGSAELRAVDLAPDVAEQCIALSRGLGLAFAGIDLKITPDVEIFCFEVNPCPAFSFYEANTDQPIAHAVARYPASCPCGVIPDESGQSPAEHARAVSGVRPVVAAQG
jgi:hypothetical protein